MNLWIIFVNVALIVTKVGAFDDALKEQMGIPWTMTSPDTENPCVTQECWAQRNASHAQKRDNAVVQTLNSILKKLNMTEPPQVNPSFSMCLKEGVERIECALRARRTTTTTTTTPSTAKPSRGTVKIEPEEGKSCTLPYPSILATPST